MSKLDQARQPATIEADHIAESVAALDWPGISSELDAHGCAEMAPLLSPEQCAALAGLYDLDGVFRSRVVMARHGFGRGEYQYFSYPLPPLIAELRTALYRPLAEIANRWNDAMGIEVRYPGEHRRFFGPLPCGGPAQAHAAAAALWSG